MGNIAGPRPVVINLSENPRDRYVVPCSCGHDYGDHKRYGNRCKQFDSYGSECECPSYEADENIIADFTA